MSRSTSAPSCATTCRLSAATRCPPTSPICSAAVGCETPPFAPAAVEALFQAAQGLPRKLGLYGHHALLAAAVAKAKVVSPEHVQAALKEAS